MADGVFIIFKQDLMTEGVDLETDTVHAILMSSGYTFSSASNLYVDITDNEASGTGYTAGGVQVMGQSVTTGATCKFDGTDTTWANSTITAQYAVLLNSTNANHLMACYDFGSDKSTSAGTFTIQWNASGIITIA